jgi:hypothetical protein
LMTPLLLGAAFAFAASGVFLVQVAAPILLHLPYHHCPYDLIPNAPEMVIAVALLFGGLMCVGWSAVLAWLGRAGETNQAVPGFIHSLLSLAFFCVLGFVLMVSVALALASV